jgi:hypothetical protein
MPIVPTETYVNQLIEEAISGNVHPVQVIRIPLAGVSIPIAGNQSFTAFYEAFSEEATSTVSFEVVSSAASIIVNCANHGFDTTHEAVNCTIYNLNILGSATFNPADYIQVTIVEIP